MDPLAVKSNHWNHWLLAACPAVGVAVGNARGSVVVPVNDPPPLFDTLRRMSLLHAPGVLTPWNRFVPNPEKPFGTQPLDSCELRLMYEPNVTTMRAGLVGST